MTLTTTILYMQDSFILSKFLLNCKNLTTFQIILCQLLSFIISSSHFARTHESISRRPSKCPTSTLVDLVRLSVQERWCYLHPQPT